VHEKEDSKMVKLKYNTTEMLEQFRRTYGYVEIDKSIVTRFVRKFKTDNIHLLYDWCLSQGIHYGVQE